MKKLFGCIIIMVLSLSAYSQDIKVTKQLVDSLANTLVVKKSQDVKIVKQDSVIQLLQHRDSVHRNEIQMYQQDGVDCELALTHQEQIIANKDEDLAIAGHEIKKAGVRGLTVGAVLGAVATVLLFLMTQ